MVERKQLKAYVQMLDHKFRVKYNRAKVRQLEQKLSGTEDPDELNDIFMDEFYDQDFARQQPNRTYYVYK